METFKGMALIKKIPASVWVALGVVGMAASMLWWESSEERIPAAPVRQAMVGPLVPKREFGNEAEPEPPVEDDAPAPEENVAVAPACYDDPLPLGAIARMGTMRLYHEGGVSCCCFLPDGLTLATGGGDGTIRFWETATGKEQRVFRGHTASIPCLAFTPDGRTMASASWDNTVRLWDVASGKQLHVLSGHVQGAFRCAFAPDGKTLVTSDRGRAVRQWDTAIGKELPGFVGHAGFVISLAYTPDGRTLVSGAQDHTISLWDVSTTQQRQGIILPDDVRLVAVSPDGKVMAQETRDKTIRVVDIASGKVVHNFPGHEPFVYSTTFSPDGRTLATGSHDRLLRVWDIVTGKKLWETQQETGVGALAFSGDGNLLASASHTSIHIWDARTGVEHVKVPRLQAITTLQFSADGQALTTASIDRTVCLWEAATGKQLRCARVSGRVIDLSPDGKVAAAIPERRDRRGTAPSTTLCLCDTATGKRLHLLRHQSAVRGVAFAPGGEMVAVPEWSDPSRTYLYEVATGKEIRHFAGQPVGTSVATGFTTLPIAFSPDGKTLACGCRDCTVRLWDVATGQQRRQFGQPFERDRRFFGGFEAAGISCLAFSADGKTLAAAEFRGNNPIRLWDVASGGELRQLLEHERYEGWKGWVNTVVFSPDGKTLALARRSDSTIHLWDGDGQATPTPSGAPRRGVFLGLRRGWQSLGLREPGRHGPDLGCSGLQLSVQHAGSQCLALHPGFDGSALVTACGEPPLPGRGGRLTGDARSAPTKDIGTLWQSLGQFRLPQERQS